MGGGAWTSSNWDSYKKTNHISRSASVHSMYASSTKPEWLPYNVIRESCDSDEHPNSTPIILGLDVTGSMSDILQTMAVKLGVVMEEIYKRNTIPDPQILFSAIDDYITSDKECIQVTQFESDIRIAEQMKELKFIERGGGNNWESYALAWYFAARHTKCDAFKNGRKGIIITMGDDGLQPYISRSEISDVFGDTVEDRVSVSELLSELQRNWEVFHITMTKRHGEYSEERVLKDFEVLGDHSIRCDNVEYLPEIIVSLLEKVAGKTVQQIVSSWDGSTAIAVQSALSSLSTPSTLGKTGVVEF